MKYFIIYLVIINIVAISICISDKEKARRGQWRISEKILFFISAVGGAFGMFATMIFIRHKTKQAKFMLGLSFLILLQFVILILVLQRIT